MGTLVNERSTIKISKWVTSDSCLASFWGTTSESHLTKLPCVVICPVMSSAIGHETLDWCFQEIPQDLQDMAERFRVKREREREEGGGRRGGFGGRGGGGFGGRGGRGGRGRRDRVDFITPMFG